MNTGIALLGMFFVYGLFRLRRSIGRGQERSGFAEHSTSDPLPWSQSNSFSIDNSSGSSSTGNDADSSNCSTNDNSSDSGSNDCGGGDSGGGGSSSGD